MRFPRAATDSRQGAGDGTIWPAAVTADATGTGSGWFSGYARIAPAPYFAPSRLRTGRDLPAVAARHKRAMESAATARGYGLHPKTMDSTTRNPTLLLKLSGTFLLRYAHRAFL